MLINAPSTTNRTKILTQEYLKLLNNGIEAQDILVLVQNSSKKKEFIDEVKARFDLGSIGNLKIYSFAGLIYNYILENWPVVENSIKSDKNRKIIPNLCGLEVSQYILKDCIKEVDFTGYNSKTSLLHQLFRRNSLINLNNIIEQPSTVFRATFPTKPSQTTTSQASINNSLPSMLPTKLNFSFSAARSL